MLNLHCNHHAHAEFDDSITLLAPPWGSAVHFGGAKIRARIALSLKAVRQNSRLNLHCDHHAHADFDDSIEKQIAVYKTLPCNIDIHVP